MAHLGDTATLDLRPFRKKEEFVILWHQSEKYSGLKLCLDIDPKMELDRYDFTHTSIIKSHIIMIEDLQENPHIEAAR